MTAARRHRGDDPPGRATGRPGHHRWASVGLAIVALVGASPAAVPADAVDRPTTEAAAAGIQAVGVRAAGIDAAGIPASDIHAAVPTPAPRGWQWPLQPRPAVVRPFDAPEQRWSAGHRGVDLAAPPATSVRSPARGTVVFVGVVVDRPVLTIDHGDGLRSSLEPVTATVHRGDRVSAGQVVGRLTPERSHCSPGTCLHWGVRLGEDYVDPLGLILDRRPSVLLPLSGGSRLP